MSCSRLGLLACCAVSYACLSGVAWAADDGKGKWVSVSAGVVAQIEAAGKKIGWPGLTSGVGVDRTTGDVYMVVCDNGLWKSTDHGQNFSRVDGQNISGRCETGFGLDLDPAGKRVACFTVYGNSALSSDAGQTWQRSSTGHLDCIAVDWAGLNLLSIRHESSGVAILSPDGGKTWQTLGKGFNAVGLFDGKTLVATKDAGILRSTDGGQTWTTASDLKPTGKAMRVFHEAGYWIGGQGVLVSRDRVQAGRCSAARCRARWGPASAAISGIWPCAVKRACWQRPTAAKRGSRPPRSRRASTATLCANSPGIRFTTSSTRAGWANRRLNISGRDLDLQVAVGVNCSVRHGVQGRWCDRFLCRRLSDSVIVCQPPQGNSGNGQRDNHHDPSNIEAQATEAVHHQAPRGHYSPK